MCKNLPKNTNYTLEDDSVGADSNLRRSNKNNFKTET